RRFVPLSRGGVYYAFLFQSQPLFQKFFSGDSDSLNRLTVPTRSRCAVSVEAHYRELFRADKCLFQKYDR
ncbi:MAG: hypothetical protein E7C36_08505, partial [Mixta calida]|nr:hypothetical protein [Mixta calida]